MADNDSEKTEYTSQKKLEQSRERGELPRSNELNTFIIFGLTIIYFSANRMGWFEGLGAIVSDLLHFDRHMGINRDNLGEFLIGPAFKAMMVLAPLLGLILVISPLITLIQTGFNIASVKLTPDLSRLNPADGISRIFSANQWMEGGKSCAKIGLFAWLAWGAIHNHLPQIASGGSLDVREQIGTMFDVTLAIGIRICIVMAILSVGDFAWQWLQFNKRLRMTMQEMKDETKEREGNPMIKQRQRSLAMQRLRQQMMKEVPKASVIVTNPTHFAVALTYDRNRAPAPYVSARGTQYMALRIKEIAKQHNIPIIENKPLARALYKNVKVGQIIPAEFYKAVAEVLAFVFLLKKKRTGAPGTAAQAVRLSHNL